MWCRLIDLVDFCIAFPETPGYYKTRKVSLLNSNMDVKECDATKA
jgi:hypothetical protein